jgi:sugar-specific transcriptional regulator TrmB
MSLDYQEQLTKALSKLGLSLYQAKIYSALASLGPSGVAEIQRISGVPRTKIYEVLEQLVDMGAVEFQSGRPTIYNALSPSVLVDRMRNSYLNAADDATRLLSHMQQTEKNTAEDLAWTVRGKTAVYRKAALTIASAKKSVLMVEQYPPKLMTATLSIMKALHQKNVNVRAVCILKPWHRLDENLKTEDFVEYRKITSLQDTPESDDLLIALRLVVDTILARESSLVVIDDQESFIYFPDRRDKSKSLGLTLKISGLPMIQRLMFERVVQQGTIRVR